MRCVENNAQNIKEAVKILRKGGTVAHPADTCFGLAADLASENALKKLQKIKGRDAGKPMSIMLPPHLETRLNEYAELNEFAEMVCARLFPGPVTIVLPKGLRIPEYFFPNLSTVGIRIPYAGERNDLLTLFREPLITTSANLSDQPVCCTCEDVINVFKNSEHQPDLFLTGEIRGKCIPSTVISPDGNKINILREGPLGKKQLEAILGISI